MPLIDRPILSTIERKRIWRDNRPDGLLDLSNLNTGLLNTHSGRGAHVQSDLRALDGWKEVPPEIRCECERGQNRGHEASDKDVPPSQSGHEQASIKRPHGFEASFKSALEKHERIARRWEMPSVTVRRLTGEQEAGHRVDQRAREHVGADESENDRFRHGAKQEAGDSAEGEHRHENDADAQKRDGRRNDDLTRAVHDRGFDVFALLQMVVDVLDRHGRVINEDAHRKGEAAQRHDIDGFAGRSQERDRG